MRSYWLCPCGRPGAIHYSEAWKCAVCMGIRSRAWWDVLIWKARWWIPRRPPFSWGVLL